HLSLYQAYISDSLFAAIRWRSFSIGCKVGKRVGNELPRTVPDRGSFCMARHFKKRAENRLVDTALPKRAGKYADGKGLWLYVTPRGSRSWVFRYKPNLREPEKAEGFMGLGSYPAVSLATAREKAQQAREDIARGKDPITANEHRAAEQVKATEGQTILRRT